MPPAEPRSDHSTSETIWRLTERVKELTALHGAARAMQDDEQSPEDLVRRVLALVRPAWQFPEIAEARISVGGLSAATPGWRETPWTQRATFVVSPDERGVVEVAYTEARPDAAEGPFLVEERALLDSVAEMLRRWFRHRAADRALAEFRAHLERLVEERSAALSRANEALRCEVAEHREARIAVERTQQQLRDMANAVCIAGERERRGIAQALHDHVGQSLAFARMRLSDLRGNAVFCGFEDDLTHVLRLLDGCLKYTRDLTCELSPPRLHELGLDAALEWLAESYRGTHRIAVRYRGTAAARTLDEEGRAVLYAAAHEFLANAVRHGRAASAEVVLTADDATARLEVRDDGCGFDPAANAAGPGSCGPNRFGLFSLRERLRSRGGTLSIGSAPGAGTRAAAEIPIRFPPELRR